MSDSPPALPLEKLTNGTVTYENVRVVITPETPYHYAVQVRDSDGEVTEHAVERVAINNTRVLLDGPIWFADVKLDVGVPLGGHGDTAWVWS